MAKKPSVSTKGKPAAGPAKKPVPTKPVAKASPVKETSTPARASGQADPKGASKGTTKPVPKTGASKPPAPKPAPAPPAAGPSAKAEASRAPVKAPPAKAGAPKVEPNKPAPGKPAPARTAGGVSKQPTPPSTGAGSATRQPVKGAGVPPASKDAGKPGAKAPTKDVKEMVKPGGKPAGAGGGAGIDAPVKPAPKRGKGKPEPAPLLPGQRYSVMTSDAMAASRAAAAKLAAAAGLHPVVSTANGDVVQRTAPRLTKSPFGKKELAEFREMLLVKRLQIMGDVSSLESEALTGGAGGSLSHLPQHMADQGTDTFDQSLALDLVASQRTLLKEINDALTRIDGGTYGVCEDLGKAISVDRLRHTPWARYCIEAARHHERAAWHR